MENTIREVLRGIEQREGQLWLLTLALFVLFGTVTVATYFFIFGEIDPLAASPLRVFALAGLGSLIGVFCGYVVYSRVTLGKMKRLLEVRIVHDELTGLINRPLFEERLKQEMAYADRSGKNVGILLCDFDHFKTINANHGHEVGDEALKQAGKSICESTRGTDKVFRWGGDEMMVILSDTTREGVLIATDRIRKAIQKVGEALQLDLDISIGVALYPEHGRDCAELIYLADQALQIAKEGGSKVHIGKDLFSVRSDSIQVVFQCVVDLRTGEPAGYEAFSADPEGKLNIQELFRRHQAVGQLVDLKCVCLEKQIQKAAKAAIHRVFINTDCVVLERLISAIKPPDLEVILEISESEALKDTPGFLKVASKWRKQGFKFAIDDFEGGLSSLAFITEFVPEYIKLNRSTVQFALASSEFRAFLKNLIPVLEKYTAQGVIAKKIETEAELEVVKSIGIRLAQGYYLGKPGELSG